MPPTWGPVHGPADTAVGRLNAREHETAATGGGVPENNMCVLTTGDHRGALRVTGDAADSRP